MFLRSESAEQDLLKTELWQYRVYLEPHRAHVEGSGNNLAGITLPWLPHPPITPVVQTSGAGLYVLDEWVEGRDGQGREGPH